MKNAIQYGAYVKYDYNGHTINQNDNYKLITDEMLVIYYKTQDSSDSPYTRVVYEEGTIVSPNFNLSKTVNGPINNFLTDPTVTPNSVLTCSASQSITIKELNEITLNNSINYIYVIGEEYKDSEGKNKYRLNFIYDKTISDNSQFYDIFSLTLQNEQQLIYVQNKLEYLNIVGSGTKITIKNKVDGLSVYEEGQSYSIGQLVLYENKTYKCINNIQTAPSTFNNSDWEQIIPKYEINNEIVSIRNIQRFGVSALQKYWKEIPAQITILAQDFVNVIGTADDYSEESDAKVTLNFDSVPTTDVVLTRNGLEYDS